MILNIILRTHLRGKRVSVHGVLATGPIIQPKMQMYFVELIPITQRATRYVDRMARVIVHGENYAVASVRQHTTYPVLVHVKGLQVRVEEEPGRFQVHRRLTSALVAQPPIRIDETPEPGTFESIKRHVERDFRASITRL